MKQALLKLFTATPALQGKDPEFCDNLAEDVQAVIIRALGLAAPSTDPQLDALENAVEDIWVSDFGIALSNAVTMDTYPHKQSMPYTVRYHAVRAMIQTLLLEQAGHFDTGRGEMMQQRLKELSATIQ